MNRLIMRFPEGKEKALTLSYDDGVNQDVRLVALLDRHGIKGTFNLNSTCLDQVGPGSASGHTYRMNADEMRPLYLPHGHEIAVHSVTHPFLEKLPTASALMEVLEDRRRLEETFGTIVRGMAYPFGTTDDELVEALRYSGIAYARTIRSTERFDIPTDWLRLPATCHHNNPRLMELWEQFMAPNTRPSPRLFYLWGHAYEFDDHDNWEVIERFCEAAGGHDDVWYATNIEIFDYVQAYERLQFSVDTSRVYNPNAISVWFATDRWPDNIRGEYVVRPGETLELK